MENVQSILNIIIAYDNEDETLGTYFTACKDHILDFLEEQRQNGFPLKVVEIIDNRNCHSVYIDLKLEEYKNAPLLFIAYSHGLPHSLRCNHVAYIHVTDSHSHLFNSLLYTNACLSALDLGAKFEDFEGGFIGFNKEVRAFKQESGKLETSIKCDNSGLQYAICNPENSIEDTHIAMKSYYTSIIDKWDEIGENVFFISELRRTRDALKIYGKKNQTIYGLLGQVFP